ncbi:MAG: DNA photolyase family protein [Coriobacteriia bacterium]|nr:DNA photolyase family protein [Coriobacteriia bacterium]
MTPPAVMWFRRDLRLADNRALTRALARAAGVICVCMLEDAAGAWAKESASRAWRAASLKALDSDLRERGNGLVGLRGTAPEALADLAKQSGARLVCCTRDWTPAAMAEEEAVREALAAVGTELFVAEGSLLVTPDSIATHSGEPFRVFTPYYRAWEYEWHVEEPLPALEEIPAPAAVPTFEPSTPDSSAPDIATHWSPGERGSQESLTSFVNEALADYDQNHDFPAVRGTSRLSPALAFGELSPRQIAVTVVDMYVAAGAAAPYLRQLAWREFAHHVLYHAPSLPDRPWRAEYEVMPWCDDEGALAAWREGMTGFPFVDAGMRELRETGWMHNRTRLVTGSFLAKDLLVPWQDGERWFWERLVDAELAVNAFNWQWLAGSGADAAPYFRIFNPMLQGRRFDPDGSYVRRWVPELAQMPARWIHSPWEAPAEELSKAGVVLGKTYPRPLIDHFEARDRALAAYEHVKESRSGGA